MITRAKKSIVFEVLFAQLSRLSFLSKDKFNVLEARLNDLAHDYAGTPTDCAVFSWEHEHVCVVKSLLHSKSIH